jgi:hypothetical protein
MLAQTLKTDVGVNMQSCSLKDEIKIKSTTCLWTSKFMGTITEASGIHSVLFGIQNTTFGSHMAATHRILMSVMGHGVDFQRSAHRDHRDDVLLWQHVRPEHLAKRH